MYDTYDNEKSISKIFKIIIPIILVIGFIALLFVFRPFSKSNTTFSLEQKEVNLSVDSTYQIKVEDNSKDRNYKYKSLDEKIAKVDENGVVTPVSNGTTEIEVVSGKHKETIKVTIIDIPQDSIELKYNSVVIYSNDKYDLSKIIVGDTHYTYTYKSSAEHIVTVDKDGIAIGKEVGKAKVFITTKNGVSTEVDFTVVSKKKEVNKIEVDNKNLKIILGKTTKINAYVYPEDAEDKSVKWISSNTNIVSVDQDGNIKAKSPGNATITVETNNGIKTSINVVVVKTPVPEKVVKTEIEVDKVVFEKEIIELTVGGSIKANYTIYPQTATNKNVIWSTDNNNVISINKDGIIRGKKAGVATVTIKTHNNKTAILKVTVKNQVINPSEIKITTSNQSIYIGDRVVINAEVYPYNATDKSITWNTSNKSIAIVNNGIVTGVGEGTATITAKTSNGKTASIKVTVSKKIISIKSISLNTNNLELEVGKSSVLVTKVLPENATNKKLTWKSDDSSIATVSNGKVTAKKSGTTKITVISDNGLTSTCTVKVIVPVDSIALQYNKKNVASVTTEEGQKVTLTPVITPSNATYKNLTWTSSNSKIATIKNGVVSALSPGKAIITARTHNNKIATMEIVVNKKKILVSGISLNKKSLELEKGKNTTLTATISPSNADNKKVTWITSDATIATVSTSGVVTGKKVGKVTITAKSNNGKTATCTVNVVIPVSGVDIQYNSKSTSSVSMLSTKTITLKGVISPSNATNKTITWTSSNNKIATINKNGVVTPKRTGIVTITAKSSNGKKDTIKVTITGYRIHFLNINGGDSILLESNGSFALLDTGTYSSRKQIESYLNSLDVKTLEFLILSHKHSDHAGSAQYLYDKFTIKKLYTKKYIKKDTVGNKESWQSNLDNYNNIIKKFGSNVVYVDSAFKETATTSKYITLGDKNIGTPMKIYFYNAAQRMNDKSKCGGKTYKTYQEEGCFSGSSENNNSLVNLVQANNHNVLLTGDMTSTIIWKWLQELRLNNMYIDVFKVPHHGVWNCVGAVNPNASTIFKITKANIGYYQVTGSVNGNSSPTVITPDYINDSNGTKRRSCFSNLAQNDTGKYKAKDLMCKYTRYSKESDKANIYNLTESTIKVAGGGLGKDKSKYCK